MSNYNFKSNLNSNSDIDSNTSSYSQLHQNFRWSVPDLFNIAQACCLRWATDQNTAHLTAIIEHTPDPINTSRFSFAELQLAADNLSLLMIRKGVKKGDFVASLLPQSFESAAAYLAIIQMGAVAVPLSHLFGSQALLFRLRDSGAVAAFVNENTYATVAEILPHCEGLQFLIGTHGAVGRTEAAADREFLLTPTAKDDLELIDQIHTSCKQTPREQAALLIYTSGTTGPPKGALLAQRSLIGNLPGFVASQNWFGFEPFDASVTSSAVFWSPADWAWTGGLMDALLPTLYFGRPIVAWGGRFSAELAFDILQQHHVSHTFLFPTALKAMMKSFPKPREHFVFSLKAIMSAGESVGEAVFAYCKTELGVILNEMFGQTEVNYIVGNCSMNLDNSGQTDQSEPLQPIFGSISSSSSARPCHGWAAKPSSMGRPYPGHQVAVINAEGLPCAVGEEGEIAINRKDIHGHEDPIFFLGYWKNDAATKDKFIGNWCKTGDRAVMDDQGYLWYLGRTDDMFKSAGYRIGPSEIENCLIKHPAVANAAVIPKPDAERGAVIKACIVLAAGFLPSAELIAQLQEYVRDKLAPYQYPKEIEFMPELPTTTTGKIQRNILREREKRLENSTRQ